MFSKFKKEIEYEKDPGYWPTCIFERCVRIHNEDLDRFRALRLQLSPAIALLQQSYTHFANDLVAIFSDLLGSQPITVTSFPQLSLPLIGTIIKTPPIVGSKKLMTLHKVYPDLQAVGESLIDEFNMGNMDALFRRIDQLQNAQYPVFVECFSFLSNNWDRICDAFSNHHLPPLESFYDKKGHFDFKKMETIIVDLDFYNHEPVMRSNPALYGLGIAIILNGRLDVLAHILNDKLHTLDALFLKFILPKLVESSIGESLLDKPEDSLAEHYFRKFFALLNQLDDSNFKNHSEFAALSRMYQEVSQAYFFSVITPENKPGLNHYCIVHVFAVDSVYDELMSDGYYSVFKLHSFCIGQDRKLLTKKCIPNFFKLSLLNPLMTYSMGLILQAPVGKLIKLQGLLGPILRMIFPGMCLDLLSAPLNDLELQMAMHLLTTPAQTPLRQSLQTYHLSQLISPDSLVINGLQVLVEGFINVSENTGSKTRTIYQGSHDVYQLGPLYSTVKGGARELSMEIGATYQLWHRVFGFQKHRHLVYETLNNAPYCHASLQNPQYVLHLTPNTPAIKQAKSAMLFFPVAMDDQGLYCHLSAGAHLKGTKRATQYIASGCCLLGNDLVATLEVDGQNGNRKRYHLLDAHEPVPEGRFVDITFNHQEHPEETMYLAVQKALAPFYRETFCDKHVVFYYHDLRMDYLFYLLPHFIKGTMSEALLRKGIAIIDQRHQLMITKLTAIYAAQEIECRAFSALNALDLETLLNRIDALKNKSLTAGEIETTLINQILHFMANDPVVDPHARQVYTYVLTQKEHLADLSKRKGLHCIAILNYIAQFAVLNQMTQTSLLVALLSIEYKLLQHYEQFFAEIFGSVIHFLWMNPINLRDDEKHNRLYFIEHNILEFCRLISTSTPSLLRVVKHQALDNPFGVVAELDELRIRLANLPHFFAKTAKPCSSPNHSQVAIGFPQNPP